MIYHTNIDKYDKFLNRFVTVNINYILFLIFATIILSTGSVWLPILIMTPVVLFTILRIFIPCSKILIKEIELDNQNEVRFLYKHYSKTFMERINVGDIDLSIKYPYGGTPGTPDGSPLLIVNSKGFKLKQYALDSFLSIWNSHDIKNVFLKLREAQKIEISDKEKKILARISKIKNNH